MTLAKPSQDSFKEHLMMLCKLDVATDFFISIIVFHVHFKIPRKDFLIQRDGVILEEEEEEEDSCLFINITYDDYSDNDEKDVQAA